MTEKAINNCSLIVATYNWPQALELCLESIRRQSILPGELIIADDGSGKETAELINKAKDDFPIPVVHIWHEDEGFRLAMIRNKAFAAASYNYIIQIDGDLILHRHFVKDHLSLAQEKYFVTGSRALLTKEATEKILAEKDINQLNAFTGKWSNFFNGLRIGIVRKLLAKKYKSGGNNKYYVKGCNMAFWKSDLLLVNGYNEAFTGWGREDSELAIRLINAGIKKQFIKSGGICYHLYHPEASRDLEARNIEMMKDAIARKTIFAEKGINLYLTK